MIRRGEMDAVNDSSTTADDGLSVTSQSSFTLSETLDLFVALVGEQGDDDTTDQSARMILQRSEEERMSSPTETVGGDFVEQVAAAAKAAAQFKESMEEENAKLQAEIDAKDALIAQLREEIANNQIGKGVSPIRKKGSGESSSPSTTGSGNNQSASSDTATIGLGKDEATLSAEKKISMVKHLLEGALNVIRRGEVGVDTVKALDDALNMGKEELDKSFRGELNKSMGEGTASAQDQLDPVYEKTAWVFTQTVIKAAVVGTAGVVDSNSLLHTQFYKNVDECLDAGLVAWLFQLGNQHKKMFHGDEEDEEDKVS